MVKTRAMMEWEYAAQLGPDAQEAISTSDARLAWMRTARSDYEIALPLHELSAFARAEGYYAGLPADIRLGQIDRILDLAERLYPAMRIYLYDARQIYSAPITVFGPLLAVVYLGVTSRKVVGLFPEQLWFEFVPVLHRLQGRFAAQG
jgi:hypothetical protein